MAGLPKLTYWRFVMPHLARRLGLHVRRLFSLPRCEVSGYLKGRWKALRLILFAPRHQSLLEPHSPIASRPAPKQAAQGDYYLTLVSRYHPEKYMGTIDLFASDVDNHKIPPQRLFQHYSRGGLRVHRVDGDHNSLIDKDHAQEFANVFQRVIDAA